MLRPIYTEPENCQDCYKCLRECPVKAISIENNKAFILEERCIYCGHCVQVCPTGAKKIRDGLTRAQLTLSQHPKVYLSLAPSYVSEFPDIPAPALIAALRQLGFAGVSETALGAELVTAKTEEFLAGAEKDVYISSACPVVVDYIRKYAPEYVPHITPILSPMLAHAKILKEAFGPDIKIIFAGPCIAKKEEADRFGQLIDVAITFKDLKTWFEKEGIDLHDPVRETREEQFVPYRSRSGALYPVEGGMLKGMRPAADPVCHMAFSDLRTIREVLKGLDTAPREDSLFLELLACTGGCVNGPARLSPGSLAAKRYEIVRHADTGDPREDFRRLDLSAVFRRDEKITRNSYSEEEIKQALAAVGKLTPEDELNCSSCGYDSCRDFAVALLENRAEDNMCASYMRKIAHDKATVLLQKLPTGVVLANADLKVVDMNRSFAVSMGPDLEEVYDACPGLEGADLKNVCPFEHLFRTALTTGTEIIERRVKDGDRTWILSIYNIQPHLLVFGLLQDLEAPNVQREWMAEKTREVIRNHMTTVQQVACLLGENAAFTDATLRAVLEAYEKENNHKE